MLYSITFRTVLLMRENSVFKARVVVKSMLCSIVSAYCSADMMSFAVFEEWLQDEGDLLLRDKMWSGRRVTGGRFGTASQPRIVPREGRVRRLRASHSMLSCIQRAYIQLHEWGIEGLGW